MTKHLSPHEFIESLDGVLPVERLDHLTYCDACRGELEQLRELMSDVEASAGVPQPSPLFWDHFSERVRQATSDAPTPAAVSWWSQAWRPAAAFAAGLAAVALVVVMRSGAPAPSPGATGASLVVTAAESSAPDEVASELFLSIASTLTWEDVEQVAMPRTDTVDALIEQLTPAEREQFVRMLRARVGEIE